MAELKLKHTFDPKRRRHYLNDQLSVLHCHHYATLFTQLGLDAKDIVDGTRILKESTEDVFYEVLASYYKENNITEAAERIDIAVQMFSAVGMGKMSVVSNAESGGEIEMPYAYVDEGWLKKWGKYKAPVNFIGAGYVAGMFSAVFDKPTRTYTVTETQSKVMGAGKSLFKVTA
jgi:predicted hydrocarbon binding protein